MNNKPANQNGNEADTVLSRSEIKIEADKVMKKMTPELKAVVNDKSLSFETRRKRIEAIRKRFRSQ